MSWRRLQVLVLNLPPESASVRATNPNWDRTDHLLAGIYDLLNQANWQRSGDKHRQRPAPLPRPGVKVPGETRFGTASMSIDEMRRRLDQANRGGDHGRRARHRVHQPGSLSEGVREGPVA